MFKITIIIPIYNTPREILERCFNSIKSQTLKDFNVIIVVNGKNINELFITNYFIECRNVSFILLEKNIGYCGARQMAIDASTTEYIAFLDSDDEIVNEYVQLFYKQISQCQYDLIFIRPNMIKYGKQFIKDGSRKNYLFKINKLKSCIVDPAGWTKIINKKFMIDNKIEFIYDVHNIIEDLYFHMCLIYKFKTAFYIGKQEMYKYYFNEGTTITNLLAAGKLKDIIVNNIYAFYKKYECDKKVLSFILRYLLISKQLPNIVLIILNKIGINKFKSFIYTLIYTPMLVIYYIFTKIVNCRHKLKKINK